MRRTGLSFVIWLFFTGGLCAATPSNVRFTSVTDNAVSVAWTLDSPDTQESWLALASDPAFSLIFSSVATPVAAETYGYSGLASNATYYFKVKVAAEDDSSYSVPLITVTLPSPPQGPFPAAVHITSVTLQWSQGSNAAGSWYQAEAAIDEGFTLNTAFSSGPALSASFEGLNPNSTWYLRVKTLGRSGGESAYTSPVSTITLAWPPSGETYALVSSTGMSVFWDNNGNPDGTVYELVVATSAGFATVNYSTITRGNYFEAAGLKPDTTHYFKAAAVNWSGLRSAFTVFAATPTYSAPPAPDPPGLDAPTATSVQAHWLTNGNPTEVEYYVQAGTAANFTGLDYGPGTWFAAPSYNVSSLESGRTYYFRVRSRDFLKRPSAWLSLGSAATLSGADVTPPSVIDLQGGDDAWRGAAGGSYMVHFSDLGDGLDRFQVKVTTGPGFSGELVADWTDAVTAINSDTYETDWPLPAPVFEALKENVTGYVSVRVYDRASPQNYTVAQDVFYVKRDTTPPEVVNHAVSPAGWLAADPGAVFDVDLNDALAGLAQAQYSASDQPNTAAANVVDWTGIAGFSPGPSFSASWGVNFAALENGATNYISVRAVDAAGNVRTVSDVFKILKNNSGPAVSISAPGGAYVSTASALAGSARQMNEMSPVASVQVALQEVAGGLYYDGSSFASASEVWLGAQGQASWSYNSSTVPFTAPAQYKVFARAKDSNGFLTPAPYPNALFQLDQAAPSVYVSTPVQGSQVYAFDEVAGTAADTGGAGLAAVDVYLRRAADGKWWNFASGLWGSVPVASATAAGAAWGFAPGPALRGALAHGQQYFVSASARDAAVPANASAFGVYGATFTWSDTVPPGTTAVFAPSTGTAPGRITLRWVFPGDDGGAYPLTYGQYAVQYSTFAGAVFSTQAAQVLISTAMVPAGAAQAFTVAGLVPETTYYLALWTMDDAGLWSGSSPQAVTLSGESLNDMISGSVKTVAGAGITGVLVEALSSEGAVAATAYTQDDGAGGFTLRGLADGFYRVQATWIQDGFSSAIAKDLIPMGYADANFVLSVDYRLASVSGTLPLSAPAGMRPAAAGGGARLLQGGRLVASASPDAAGRFRISGLLPGRYVLKVAGEDGVWRSFDLKLAAGQDLDVRPLGTLLKPGSVYAYPNPARSFVTFHAETAVAATARLSVYSLDGTLVRSAEEAVPAGGVYEHTWRFGGGAPASGVYFYTVRLKNDLSGETRSETRKFAVVR